MKNLRALVIGGAILTSGCTQNSYSYDEGVRNFLSENIKERYEELKREGGLFEGFTKEQAVIDASRVLDANNDRKVSQKEAENIYNLLKN